MTFVSRQRVRFAHVDAAGIVFYPRYFEMLNTAVEEYFGAVVGTDFADIHLTRRLGVPTVRLEADFAAPSRLGETLDFALEAVAVGRTSLDLAVTVRRDAEIRFKARAVLVCIDLGSGRAVPWPADIRPPGPERNA